MDDTFSHLCPQGYAYSRCGYCDSPSSNAAYRFHTVKGVLPGHYQTLIDRGWRRSGKHYYKPDVRHQCCSHYTIRLDADEFKPSKDQRKAVNRLSKYVLGPEYTYKVARLSAQTREEKKRRKNHFDLLNVIDAFDYARLKRPIDPKSNENVEPSHKFEVTLEPDIFTIEKYKLFAHYQEKVHKEARSSNNATGFKRFLCSGFGQRTATEADGSSKHIGSYHMCYRLDGKLVAMGVLDLLPHGVSSVYLIYESSVVNYDFGKISAMYEIALARRAGYAYYYMGFYVHSCVKMRYKAAFHPTFFLDPESLTWQLLSAEFLTLLDSRPYISPSREIRLAGIKLASMNEDDKSYIEGNKEPAVIGADVDSASLFHLQMPGILSEEEISSNLEELGKWELCYGAKTYELEDLAAWYEGGITDRKSLTGLAAELAASLGWEIVKKSKIHLI